MTQPTVSQQWNDIEHNCHVWYLDTTEQWNKANHDN